MPLFFYRQTTVVVLLSVADKCSASPEFQVYSTIHSKRISMKGSKNRYPFRKVLKCHHFSQTNHHTTISGNSRVDLKR